MKEKYRFINFKFIDFKPVTGGFRPYYCCKNNRSGDVLGYVDYDDNWKQYTFNPEPMTMFSVSCMRDIIHFMGQIK